MCVEKKKFVVGFVRVRAVICGVRNEIFGGDHETVRLHLHPLKRVSLSQKFYGTGDSLFFFFFSLARSIIVDGCFSNSR